MRNIELFKWEIIYFSIGLINRRNIDDTEFFNYIKTKYDNNSELKKMISYCRREVSYELANLMTIVLNYKLASLNNDEKNLLKYKNEFSKIKDIKLESYERVEKPTTYYFTKNARTIEKPQKIAEALDLYLNGIPDEKVKENLDISSNANLGNYIKRNIHYIENYDKFVRFYIKYHNIEKTSIEEIDQFIITIEFFLKHLIENYFEGNTLMSKYGSYESLLEYFKNFKNFIQTGSEEPKTILGAEIKCIDDDFLNEQYKLMVKIIKYYRYLSNINKISDESISEIKSLYLKNIIKN